MLYTERSTLTVHLSQALCLQQNKAVLLMGKGYMHRESCGGSELRNIPRISVDREGFKEETSLSCTLEMGRNQRAERRKEGTLIR